MYEQQCLNWGEKIDQRYWSDKQTNKNPLNSSSAPRRAEIDKFRNTWSRYNQLDRENSQTDCKIVTNLGEIDGRIEA